MSDATTGQQIPDLGIAITTEEGKKVRWTPRPHVYSLRPRCDPGPTPANSPTQEQAPGGGLSRPFDSVVVERGAGVSIAESRIQEARESRGDTRARDGEEGGTAGETESKKTKVRDRLQNWKSRFTRRLKPDCGAGKREGKTSSRTGLNPALYILPDKIDEQTTNRKPSIMKRLKTFMKIQKPKTQSSKASECVMTAVEQAPFTHPSGTTANRCVKSGSEQTPFTQLHANSAFADSNFNSRPQRHEPTETLHSRSFSSTKSTQNPRPRSETIDSMSCQPPSLLDSPRTQRSRLIEQRSNDMITASLSTSPEGSGLVGHHNQKADCNHKGWRWCCKCNVKREKSIQQEANTTIPHDAASLTTYSDESDESLVNVVVDSPPSPVIDDSLIRMKTYDLRVLDSVLMEQSQSQTIQIDKQSKVLQLPGATQLRQSTNNLQVIRRAQIQRHSSNVESREYHRFLAQIENPSSERRHTDSEMPHPFDGGRFFIDDEISELNIPGPAHPTLIGRQLGALAERLGHLSNLNIPLRDQASKSAVGQFGQVAAMEAMNEKLKSIDLNENIEAIISQQTEDKVEDAIKEAMETLLDRPSLRQIVAEQNMMDNASNHSHPESFATVRSSTSISGDTSRAIDIKKRVNRQSTNTLASSYVDVFHDACSSPTYPTAPPSSPSSEHIPEEYNLAFASPTYPAAPASSPVLNDGFQKYGFASKSKPKYPAAPPNSPEDDIFEEYHMTTASPTCPDAPPPSPHSIEATNPRSSDPRVWNYPTLDSSATSLNFGFHPTLETMPGSWPEQNGFVTIPEPDFESEEGRSWRDFDTGLPMGRVDLETSQFARREGGGARESCKPARQSLGYGRKSQESNSSVEAH